MLPVLEEYATLIFFHSVVLSLKSREPADEEGWGFGFWFGGSFFFFLTYIERTRIYPCFSISVKQNSRLVEICYLHPCEQKCPVFKQSNDKFNCIQLCLYML